MSGRAPTPTGGCCSTQRPACKEGPGNGAKMEAERDEVRNEKPDVKLEGGERGGGEGKAVNGAC